MPKNLGPIAYIAEVIPNLTQTFVYREILALREYRMNIRTFSIRRPPPGSLSAEAVPLEQDTFYIFPIMWLQLVRAHFRYLCCRPGRYVRSIAMMLTQPSESWRNRWRSLLHFVYGIAAVREMEKLQITHVHAHFGWSASSIALIANQLLEIPFSVTLHAHGIFINRLLLRAKLQYAHFVVTISEYNREYIQKLFPELDLERKIHIVHCGLDPDIFLPPASPSSSDNHELMIVGVGQLAPRKGFHILVEACHHLNQRNIPFSCHILGEGEERAQLETLIDRHGLHDRVFLPGRVYQEELREILAKADVSVLPCVRHESGEMDGIPVALMESMALAIPSVSTNLSGVPELIQHEQNGLLSAPGDAISLANAIQRLYDNPEWRRKLGRAGRKTIESEFNIYKSAGQMYALFKQDALPIDTQAHRPSRSPGC